MGSVLPIIGSVNAYMGALLELRAAQMGSSVACMDSMEYAAAVADKTHRVLAEAGESVSSASRKTGIPRSTLDRKFNSGKGIQALSVRELFDLAKLANTTATELTRVYETDDVRLSA